MQEVLQSSSTVVLDMPEGNSVMYLPIDQILRHSRGGATGAQDESGSPPRSASRNNAEGSSTPIRTVSRQRSVRE